MSEEQSWQEDSGKQPPQVSKPEELLLAEDEAGQETADTAELIPAEEADIPAKPTGPIDELSAKLAAALLKSEEYRDQFLRTQADMENLRRRTEKEIQDSRKFAVERFARDLLVVLDSLELGIQAAAGDTPEVARLREGSELTLKQFLTVLEKNNVKPIDALGQKFNPEFHQAMTLQPTDEAEPNTIVKVFQKGYTINERLLRPAMVVVAQKP